MAGLLDNLLDVAQGASNGVASNEGLLNILERNCQKP